MSPKEKAEDLVEKFSDSNLEANQSMWYDNGKGCALIAVDEIINSYAPINENLGSEFEHDGLTFKFLDYWKEVKEEVEKL